MFAKLDAKDKVQQWFGSVDNETATLSLEWGRRGGKIQTKISRYTKGKNIGRKNETTPAQQAISELASLTEKKLDGGYIQIPYGTVDVTQYIKDNTQSVPRPMLAQDYHKHKGKIENTVFLQPKLDGIRCVANVLTGEMFSRQGKRVTSLPHIATALKDCSFPDGVVWVDGELYKHGMGFQTIMSVVSTTKGVHERSTEIEYHVYDTIDKEVAFWNRFEPLKNCWSHVVETVCETKSRIKDVHDQFVKSGYEGTIVRHSASGYETSKRSTSLLKYKDFMQEEFVIIGFQAEKHKDSLGAVTLTDGHGVEFNARPAMSVTEKQDLWVSRNDHIGKMATVKFFERTDGGTPRFPVLVGIRESFDI